MEKEYNIVLKEKKIFEGEYKKGNINGKGIAYDHNENIIYEGIYVNGEKWSRKEYEYKKDIQFEQEYINGKRNGKIIMREYYGNNRNKLKFEGESTNKIRNGKGKEFSYKEKFLLFEGNYLNGERNGFGIEYNFDEGYFKGIFKEGKKWNGVGFNKNNIIEYEIIEGYGQMKEYYQGKCIFEGECKNGIRHGFGKEYHLLTGRIIYKGKFIYGKKFE